MRVNLDSMLTLFILLVNDIVAIEPLGCHELISIYKLN